VALFQLTHKNYPVDTRVSLETSPATRPLDLEVAKAGKQPALQWPQNTSEIIASTISLHCQTQSPPVC